MNRLIKIPKADIDDLYETFEDHYINPDHVVMVRVNPDTRVTYIKMIDDSHLQLKTDFSLRRLL